MIISFCRPNILLWSTRSAGLSCKNGIMMWYSYNFLFNMTKISTHSEKGRRLFSHSDSKRKLGEF